MADFGEFVLQRYAENLDPADLDTAIVHLEAELTADPAGPDSLWRAHLLGLAYAERGDLTRSVDDYDRAIAWLTDVVVSLDPGPERDEDAVALIDAWFERTRVAGYGEEHAASIIGDLAAGASDEKTATYARAMQGLTLLAEDDADPAAGVALLAPALDDLTPDTPRYVQASAWLCLALRQLGPHEVSRSIEVGRRAAGTAAADDPSRPLLMDFLAQSYQDRWDDGEADPDDLDQAIACWRQAIEAGPDPEALARCGRLLRERAERGQNMADVTEAVAMLERAVRDPGPLRWFQLAKACHAGWKIGRDPALLRRAASAVDQAVAGYDTVDDGLLWLHVERLMIDGAMVEDQTEQHPADPPADAVTLRRHVGEARAVWQQAAERAEPDTRAALAAMLAAGEVHGGISDPGSIDIERVASLVAIGRTMTNPAPEWIAILDALDAGVEYIRDTQKGGHRDGGLTPLVRALQNQDVDEDTHEWMRQLMPIVLIGKAIRSGDRRLLQAAMVQAAGSDPDMVLVARVLDLLDRAQHGEDVSHDVRRVVAELAADPPSYTAQQMVTALLHLLEGIYEGGAGRPMDVDRTPLPPVTGLDAIAVIGSAMAAAAGPFAAALTRHDLPALRDCAARFTEIAVAAPPEDTMQFVVGGLAGLAELAVVRDDPDDRAAAARAAAWFARTTAIAGGPQHPKWALAALNHGEALRRMAGPDLTRSRQLGLSALRGFAWQVLLQSGTDDAVTVAAEASAAALTVAGWCRADGSGEQLVTALDAGRGLVLHAATASRTIADQLADAGRDDLADRWRESAGFGRDVLTGGLLGALGGATEVPDDLRTSVLQVLGADDPVRGGTFTPVRSAEIREALTKVDADALVYLVPATMSQPGAAVVVPVSGDVETVILPDLVAGPHSMPARLAAAGTRDAGEAGAVEAPAGPSVDDVCRWAWSAAIGPLLCLSSRWRLDRPVRLVLVPMGLLATVPWHGAFQPSGPGRHYAVRDAVFSYAVSGRSLCTSAAFPDRPIRTALVVGDPAGDLPYANLEARAIGDAFYPACTYLSRPAEVLDWVATAAPGPSLLHFACHGHIDPRSPADAHLVLAGGTLTARRLLDASRTAELVMERVFLAACTTGVTGADHDEAFSLSTAFLAAGARTVLGSMWAVPDVATALLMYAVHHFLNAESRAPADALHRAQLWMLDLQRRPLPGMPAELTAHCDRPDLANPVSWAAFTHMGR
jgi:tetratricopeptide (TPR) repeat protein